MSWPSVLLLIVIAFCAAGVFALFMRGLLLDVPIRWPFVSRARYDLLAHNYEVARQSLADARAEKQYWVEFSTAFKQRYDALYDGLLDKYHELRIATGANAPLPVPATVVFDEPEQPPDVVLAAMQQISPVRDRTYEANWAHWERNKAKAKTNPDAFAQEILEGAEVDWTLQTR